MSVIVSDSNFASAVLASAKPVLVDFWTDWCGPCKPLGVMLDELAQEIGDRVVIAKINAETSPEVTQRFGVRGFPTMLIFKDGQVAAMRSGTMPKGKLREWIEASI